jgi:hypothetical protein
MSDFVYILQQIARHQLGDRKVLHRSLVAVCSETLGLEEM